MQKMSKKLFILLLLVVSVLLVFAACGSAITFTFVNGDDTVTVEGKVGEPVNIPDDPTAPSENQYFEGWFDEDGKEVTSRFTNKNTTFTARFGDYIVITFVDGETEVEVLRLKEGEAIEAPDALGQEGSVFNGWYNAVGATVPATATKEAAGTYTARYSDKITVKFVYDGTSSTVEGLPGEAIVFPSVIIPDGEELLGWFDADGNPAPAVFEQDAVYTVKVGSHTYNDSVTTLASNWNQHIYQTNDDSYPHDFIVTGLYGFFFDETYTTYKILPQMAAELPIDVTSTYFDDQTEGYAYKIKLNENATWENGEKITAETYAYSMSQLLDPKMKNYRATDYMDGDLEIKNAKAYYYSDSIEVRDGTDNYDLPIGDYYLDGEADCVFFGNKAATYYNHPSYHDAFIVDGVDVYQEYFATKAHVTDEIIPLLLGIAQNFGDPNPKAWYEFCFYDYTWDHTDWEDVGFHVTGEYEFDIVLERPLTGFYLFYNLSGNWIVYEDLYESCKSFENGVYSSTYCTSVATTMSYGPYVLSYYQTDKQIEFTRNENWFGYNTEENEGLYKTTKIVCQVVPEASTRKSMFLSGQLETYGLQSSDYGEYRTSPWAHTVPADTIFFMILSGHEEGLAQRQSEGVNKALIADPTFRSAMSVAFDKEDFASTISPSRSGAYGIIGTSYVWDVDNGETYRNTDAAKDVLCKYYQVTYGQGGDYPTIDAAVNAITGYDPILAKELFVKAFEDGIEEGIIKEGDKVQIEYASSTTGTSFIASTLKYLNDQLAKILEGTGYVVEIVEGGPYGNDWSTKIREGGSDTVLGGWTGSRMNPFSLTDLYVNPERAYDAKWVNAGVKTMTLEINIAKDGEAEDVQEITMTLDQWSACLNGTSVTIGETTYNFGFGQVANNTRLEILAGFELAILESGSYIPMLQDASTYLLTKKITYVTDNYNPILGFGGITYASYNYTDAEWAAYVAANNNVLSYT